MADVLSQLSQRPMQPESSPPPSPPSLDPDTKPSRKREREVSLEPLTAPSKSTDADTLQHRDTRTPAKKNRTAHLDPTEEEEDGTLQSRSDSGSPPLGASPPQEIKMRVRQISQGVEDLNWRNINAPSSGKNIDVVPSRPPPVTKHDTVKEGQEDDAEVNRAVVTPDASPDTRNDTGTDVMNPEVRTILCTDIESGDKGLKRKFLERGTSQGPPESGNLSKGLTEPLKRPRDDAEKDDNPRESKRPSPPPEPKPSKSPKKPSATTPKLSGFMAYASASSPFAGVKGQNIFSKCTTTPAPLVSPVNQAPVLPLHPPFTASTNASTFESPASTSSKPFGFGAFASPSSPFASVARSKSPVLGSTSKLVRAKSPSRRGQAVHINAFSPYASGVQSFTKPASKRVRASSPTASPRGSSERNGSIHAPENNGAGLESEPDDEKEDDRPTTFGEKLRAGRDDEDESKSDDDQDNKIVLTEQDVLTGEEDDETIHQVRGKLFALVGGQWKERGTGTLKLNVRRWDGSGARLVMRKEAVYTLLLNVTLFHGMRCSLAQDPRYLRFSVFEDGAATHYNLKLVSAKIAKELMEEINANIPAP